MVASRLKRTVDELLWGSDAFLPLTEYELNEWAALYRLEAAEREEAALRAKNSGG